jgi:hypothetical protein
MKAQSIRSQLIVMGEPSALVEDYLDSTSTPSIDDYWQYKRQEESFNAAQIRWDALNQKSSIPPSSFITGDGIAGLMSHIRKGS